MNSRLSSLATAVKSLADACSPVKRPYKVQYLKKVPDERQPGMVKGVWTVEIVDAYNREEAAQKVNPKLRPSYNCLVTLVTSGSMEGGV